MNFGDARKFCEFFSQEGLVVCDASRNDPHLIVGIAGHQIAFKNLGPAHDHFFEQIKLRFILALESHPYERSDIKTNSMRIDQRGVTSDDA